MADVPLVIETQAQFDALVAITLERGRSRWGIHTYATQMSIGDWTTLNGSVVSADTYPETLRVAVVCSLGALEDKPRSRIPEEVYFSASNRWAAGHGWDGAIWRPLAAEKSAYMDLVVGNYEPSSGELTGTAPEEIPEGDYLVYDAWDGNWVTFPAMRFTASDMLSTRSSRRASEDGVGALGVFVINDINDGVPAWLMGFTTSDPATTFGLGVTVTNGGRVALQLSDETGVRELTAVEMRADMDFPAMIGFTYSARLNKATLIVRGPHTRRDVTAPLTTINGQPAGHTLASLDFALLYSSAEDHTYVLDVAMWTYCPTDSQLGLAQSAYTELYGVGVSEVNPS